MFLLKSHKIILIQNLSNTNNAKIIIFQFKLKCDQLIILEIRHIPNNIQCTRI